jgi:coenzyme PQQ precursor peptide PqqA
MSATKPLSRNQKTGRKPARRSWVKPDFSDYDTPMEVTAYSARV